MVCQRIRLFLACSSRTADCATPGLQVGELHVQALGSIVATLKIGESAKSGSKRKRILRS